MKKASGYVICRQSIARPFYFRGMSGSGEIVAARWSTALSEAEVFEYKRDATRVLRSLGQGEVVPVEPDKGKD